MFFELKNYRKQSNVEGFVIQYFEHIEEGLRITQQSSLEYSWLQCANWKMEWWCCYSQLHHFEKYMDLNLVSCHVSELNSNTTPVTRVLHVRSRTRKYTLVRFQHFQKSWYDENNWNVIISELDLAGLKFCLQWGMKWERKMCDKQVRSSIPCLENTPLKSQQPIHRKLLQKWVWIDIKCVTDKKTWLLFFDKRIMRLVWKTPPHKSTDILLKTVANMLTIAWITFSWIETVLKLNELSRRLDGISLNRSLGIMIRTRCKRWMRKHVNIYQHTYERNQ